jgi:DHA2 family multidrug resistance protein
MSRVLGFDATQTGMMFIPGALITAFTMPIIGKLLQKVDARLLIFVGTCIVMGMMLLMSHFSSMSDTTEVAIALIVRGCGMGFLFVPINAVVLGQFRGSDLGQVAGLMNLLRQIGGSVGIALMDTLLERKTHQNELDLSSHVSLLSPGTQLELLKSGQTDFTHLSAFTLKGLYMRLDQQVYMMSFTQMIWWVLIIYSLSLIPLVLLKEPGKIDAKAALEAH